MNNFFGGLWLATVIVICVLFFVKSMPDLAVESVMSKINFESEYEIFGGYHFKDLIQKGTLSEFSNCIKKYEPISNHRKTTGSYNRLYLFINGGVKFTLSVYGDNVHYFVVTEKLDDNNERSSYSYSVN